MKVSVCMITYNHEKYIAEAIESILNQVSSFSVKLVIGEDKSTDGTRRICETYADKYPDRVQLLASEGNLGMMNNFLRTVSACEGKYIAFLEGDDYWTDPSKLQKQINFLEKNPDYSACFHSVLIRSTLSDDSVRRLHPADSTIHPANLTRDTFGTADLLSQWLTPSASLVFVNYPDFVLPDWYHRCRFGDLPYLLLLSLRGKFKYLDEVMAVYRKHDTGLSVGIDGYDKIAAMIFIYENFNIHTGFIYKEKIRAAMVREIKQNLRSYSSVENAAAPSRTSIKSRLIKKLVDAFHRLPRSPKKIAT